MRFVNLLNASRPNGIFRGDVTIRLCLIPDTLRLIRQRFHAQSRQRQPEDDHLEGSKLYQRAVR